ncbi:MAG TPA: translesion DNA synthesis-associated protein ImuA [Paucimonas sp.]|nr:translesion DNA synthesis-associated protein ImuA [Paucimonas sp.]
MSASLLRIPIQDAGGEAGRPAQAAGLPTEQLANVWRADQLGSWQSAAIPSGHGALDRELPNGGWPTAALTELMLQQSGIGEMRLLQPAFSRIAKHRPIALVQPPYLPQAAAWVAWRLPAEQLLWIRTSRAVDALWAAEQILRNGSCGALVLWQTHIRHESLRRLHLAAQASDMLFWLLRPLAAAQDASPAPLRLCLRPAAGGIAAKILKRRGPQREGSLFLPLGFAPALRFVQKGSHHAPVDRRAPAVAAARSVSPALV